MTTQRRKARRSPRCTGRDASRRPAGQSRPVMSSCPQAGRPAARRHRTRPPQQPPRQHMTLRNLQQSPSLQANPPPELDKSLLRWWLDGDAARGVACDAAVAPVVIGEVNYPVLDDLVRLCAELGRLNHAEVTCSQDEPQPPALRLREALEQQIIGKAVDLLSGPGGLASFLRRRQLGARLGGPSLPLDVGYSETVPAAIRNAVILRDKHCQWAGRCNQPAAACEVHHVKHKTPGAFEAHYNLAEMLQARGALDEAVEQFQAAVAIRPDDAVANNALGGALLAKGDSIEAVQRFSAALASRPDYFDAHYNLANVLASRGDFGGAAQQFGEAVRLNPEDANAQANLGTALAQLGRLTEAKSHYEAALRIDPTNQLARENLQQIEQMTKGSPH